MRKIYVIDLFAGFGGVTEGASKVSGVEVIACVNHDPLAIKSHAANHPNCIHYIEDIKTLDLTELIAIVEKIRRDDPDAIIVLWASLECTNHSIAKGGMSRDGDSRTLAEHLIESEDLNGNIRERYIPLLKPDTVFIENVKEFKIWGPLEIKVMPHYKEKNIFHPFCPLDIKKDKKTKITSFNPTWVPVKESKGADFETWKEKVKAFGYEYEDRILNAADYGAFTSRKRYFAQFAKPHVQISWPEQTHIDRRIISKGKVDTQNLKPWKAVKEVLNLDKHGNDIFGRTRKNGDIVNLSDKTYERVFHGLVKFVAGGKENFLIKYNSVNGKTGKYIPPSLEDPCPTVSTHGRLGVGHVQFINKYHDGAPESRNASIDNPAPTVRTANGASIVTSEFMTAYHGNGDNCHSVEGPSPTIPTHDSVALIQSEQFVMRDFSAVTNQDLNAPSGSITTSPKMNLVSAEQGGKSYYLINPQYINSGASIDQPCFTLIARTDKAPPYLVMTECGKPAIVVDETDTPYMVKIKEFMALYGIKTIRMRMFDIPELLKIQGFSPDYKMFGTQTDHKRFIGNAVEVTQAEVLFKAVIEGNQFLTKENVA